MPAQIRPSQLFRNLNAKIASIPMILTASSSSSAGRPGPLSIPSPIRSCCPACASSGWISTSVCGRRRAGSVSIENLAIYGVLSLIFSLVIGFLLAALLDQKIRFEDTFRTIFLYPFALSFIVTGLIWQWILNPEFGVQHVVRSLGWRASSSTRSTTPRSSSTAS